MGIGLAQQVFGFVDLIGGIHGHQHGADFRSSPEGHIPLGHIGGPYCHFIALFDAQRNKGSGKIVHITTEFRVGPGVVHHRVAERNLVREFRNHPVQDPGKGQIDEHILFPQILSGAGFVVIKPVIAPRAFVVPAHIVHIVRENDGGIGQFRHPSGKPFQGKAAVEVDGAQCVHHAVQGNVPLSDQGVYRSAGTRKRVFHVDMPDVSAQILHGGFRIFAAKAVRMMHVPEGSQAVAGKLVEQQAQPAGILVDPRGFH